MGMRKPDHSRGGVNLGLIITPMLDMSFQILFFFVMTYHPSALEGQLEMLLPATGQAKADKIENVDPKAASDTELELPSELTVVVRTQRDGVNDGAISQLLLQTRQGDLTVAYDDKLDTLTKLLKANRKSLANQSDIRIQADSKLKWDSVVRVMDACKNAGFKGIGFGPPPDGAGGQ